MFGFLAALGDQGPTRGAQNVFVNRRIVKDRTIAHAIIEAYSVATIKERMGATHFLMKTLPKVATEMALSVLAYNLTRVMNIVGVKPLIAAIVA